MAKRMNFNKIIVYVLFIAILNVSVIKARGTKYVTYGSVLKLENSSYKVRLHSHDIKYGTGSGQQSVTGTESKDDGNSYWLVKTEIGSQLSRGQPVKCGDTIRLEHLSTKKNLHSHHESSPLSGKQEVSAYGDKKGEGDTGDHWMLVCKTDFWERQYSVMFKHTDTDCYLGVSGRTYGSPIAGQHEVVGEYSPVAGMTEWQSAEGVFIHPADMKTHYEHTEL